MADQDANVRRLFVASASFLGGTIRRQAAFVSDTLKWQVHNDSDDTVAFAVSDDSKQCLLAGEQTISAKKTFSANQLISDQFSLFFGVDNASTRYGKVLHDGTDFEVRAGDDGNLNLISDNSIIIKQNTTTLATFTLTETTLAKQLVCAASTTSKSSLNIPSGTAPTSPSNGDIWFDGSSLAIQIAGSTYNFDVTAA